MVITEADIGWLAGFIDGEGHLGIRIHKNITKAFGVRPRFGTQIVITNTQVKMIDKACQVMDTLGVKYKRYIRVRTKYNNAQDQHCVTINPHGLRILIPILKPHLVKIPEAEILEKALELSAKNSIVRGNEQGYKGRQPMKVEILQEFDNLRMQLSALHGRQSNKLLKLKASDFQGTLKQ